jgi:hypothetical protein
MIKRRLGSALRARSDWTQCREIILRVITHKVMIVARIRVFYRATINSFLVWVSVITTVVLVKNALTQELPARAMVYTLLP